MTTELNVLKKISDNKGKASVQLIAMDLKLGSDYIRYICGDLLKKGLLKKLNSRDWYGISQKGEKELERREGKKDKKEVSRKPVKKKGVVKKGKKVVKRTKPIKRAIKKKRPVKRKRVVSRTQPEKPAKKEKAEKQVRRKSIRKHTYKEAFEELEKRKKNSITSLFKKLFRPKRR